MTKPRKLSTTNGNGRNYAITFPDALRKILQHQKYLSFFVGAGVSYPPVPLASHIVSELEKRIHKNESGEQDFDEWQQDNESWLKASDAYSKALEKAFSDDPDDQLAMNEYFDEEFLENKEPNFSHFAIALLIKHGLTNHTCITTNFDRLIEKAFMQVENGDCVPIRTDSEVDIWHQNRRHVIKVHGDSHYYNMKHTRLQTKAVDKPLAKLILDRRNQFPGMVVLGLGGHEESIKSFFKEYLAGYPTDATRRPTYRGVYWAVRVPEGEEFETQIKLEVNPDIVELFKTERAAGKPCYFFPIVSARSFFFELTDRLEAPDEFRLELKRYYGDEEWRESQLKRAASTARVTPDAIKSYRDRLQKANINGSKSGSDGRTTGAAEVVCESTCHNSKIRLLQGDITVTDADIVVSSDDVLLMMMSGVAGAIRHAAGPEIIRHVQKYESQFPLAPGSILVTGAGHMKAKHVFHVALLDLREPKQNFEPLVRKSVKRSLELMKTMGCFSVCFPLLAAGTAGFSPEQVAKVITDVTKEFIEKNRSKKFAISICTLPSIVAKSNLNSLLSEQFRNKT